MAVPPRSVHHHTVPRLHLRGFADVDEQLVQIDVLTGAEREVSVSNASVRKNFYTITMPDGTRSDAWEERLSDVESAVAPAIRRAIDAPAFDLPNNDRHLLATWIALQYLRGPDKRRQMADLASFTVYAQVGMGGLAYLRHSMRLGMGRHVGLAEAEAAWNDITSAEGPNVTVSSNEHLDILNATVQESVRLVESRSWARVRFARRRLLLSDAPVLLLSDGHSHGLGAGLASAPVLAVPLDRQTLLWLSLSSNDRASADRDVDPTAVRAYAHNLAAVLGCERFLYRHPRDLVVPTDIPFPRRPLPRTVITLGQSFANRDRPLENVLDQIADHESETGNSLIANYTWPIPGYRPPNGVGLA